MAPALAVLLFAVLALLTIIKVVSAVVDSREIFKEAKKHKPPSHVAIWPAHRTVGDMKLEADMARGK
jgi:hypothetical protein